MNTIKSLYFKVNHWLKNKYVSNGLYIVGFIALYVFYINPKVDFNEESMTGIQFENIDINEAFSKARAENKPLFIDVYATWCGPCKRMKKFTFPDEELGEYFNDNFINISIDGESPLGRQLYRNYPFNAFPTTMFIAPDGSVLDKDEGFSFAFSLLKKGKKITTQ